jgi:hypothetical protein
MAIPIIVGPAELFIFLVVAAALGRRLLKWIGVAGIEPVTAGVIATALGVAALQFLPFSLFAAGLGTPAGMRVGFAALALFLLPDIARILRRTPAVVVSALRRTQGWERVLIAIFAVTIVAVYLRALLPPFDRDALSYHLQPANQFLQTGRFRFLPTVTYLNWPTGTEVLMALARGIDPCAACAQVGFVFGLLCACAAWMLGRSRGDRLSAAISVCLLLSLVDLWREMFDYRVDVGLAACTAFTIYTLQRAGDSPPERSIGWTRLSALFAGLAATMKLSGFCVLVAATLVNALIVTRGPILLRLKRSAAYGLIGLAVVAPWLARTWALTGNPVYPIATRLFGGIEWTPQGWERFVIAHLAYNAPRGAPPTPANLHLTHLVLALSSCAIALALAGLTLKSRVRALTLFASLLIALIGIGDYLSARFLTPALVPLFAAVGASAPGRQRLLAAPLCLLAAVLAWGVIRDNKVPGVATAWRVATGRLSRDDFVRARNPMFDVSRYANANVRPGSRILISAPLQFESTALFRSEALWSDFDLQDSIHYDSMPRLLADLRRLRVRYLAVAPFDPDCRRHVACNMRLDAESDRIDELIRTHARILYDSGSARLYELSLD